jgi:hypothetical protein
MVCALKPSPKMASALKLSPKNGQRVEALAQNGQRVEALAQNGQDVVEPTRVALHAKTRCSHQKYQREERWR